MNVYKPLLKESMSVFINIKLVIHYYVIHTDWRYQIMITFNLWNSLYEWDDSNIN